MISLSSIILILTVFGSRLVGGFVTSEGCGTTKSCMSLPKDCAPEKCHFVSWSQSELEDSIDIEMSGTRLEGPGNYIAIAFSLVNTMQDGDVYFCGDDELKTATMKARHEAPVEEPLENNMMTFVRVSNVNGSTQCKFTRPLKVSKTISQNGEQDFDLKKESFYLMMAEGSLNDGYLEYHDWKAVSEEKINFTTNFVAKVVSSDPTPETTPESRLETTPEIQPVTNTTKKSAALPMSDVTSAPEAEPESTTRGGTRILKNTTWVLLVSVLVALS